MKTKFIKVSVLTLAATALFWFWLPRHWRMMQYFGAVIETHETQPPVTNE